MKIKVAPATLVAVVEKGISQKELMDQFAFRNVNSLKVGYLNALVEMGRAEGFKNERKKKAPENIVRVNSRGNLIIPKALVDQYQLNSSQIYKVSQVMIYC